MVAKVIVLGGGSAGFLAALALKVKIPELRVIVIRSKEIGIIGVGEGSTLPLTQFLHGFLGLGDKAFFEIARPTWKLGIKFIWGTRPYFYYPFGSQLDMRLPELPKNNAFYCNDDMECVSPHAALMAFDKAFERGPDGRPALHRDLAYHLENERFVAFLEAYALRVGVEIRNATVSHVLQDERGIAGLKLNTGPTETADLYVDCSGFQSLLLGKAMKEPFVSFKSSLFCDRAVVGGWDRTHEPTHPYTLSETMNSGWCWQIELENRINRGYVHSSAFINEAEAEAEFRRQNPKIRETRFVKFVSGRYDRCWVKNVVAIGNAGGFVEPLEATALSVIANRAQLLAEMLIQSDRDIPDRLVDLYNRHHRVVWDSIRRFLAVHYKFNDRIDTPFWHHCRRETDLAGAEDLVDCYRHCGPNSAWEPMMCDRLDVFGIGGYLTLLVGQRVPCQKAYVPSNRELSIWNGQRERYRQAAQRALTVEETLAALRQWPANPAAA